MATKKTVKPAGAKLKIDTAPEISELYIQCPAGYEVDKVHSTFEKIVFKKIKKELPKEWEDLKTVKGWYITPGSDVRQIVKTATCTLDNKNVFLTEEQAEASVALAQLTQLREVYRKSWTPDWTTLEDKYVICIDDQDDMYIDYVYSSRNFLAFQDQETAQLFIDNFRDLIEQAAPLLF